MLEKIYPTVNTLKAVASMHSVFKELPHTRDQREEEPLLQFNKMLQLTQAGFESIAQYIQKMPFSIKEFTNHIPVIDTVYFAAAVFNADTTANPTQATLVEEVQTAVAEFLTDSSVIQPTTLDTLLRTSSLQNALSGYFDRHPNSTDNVRELQLRHKLTQYPNLKATTRRLGGTIDLDRTYNNAGEFTEALIHVINVSSHDIITGTPTLPLAEFPTMHIPIINLQQERTPTEKGQYAELASYINGAQGIMSAGGENGEGTFVILPANIEGTKATHPNFDLILRYSNSGVILIPKYTDKPETQIKIPSNIHELSLQDAQELYPIAKALQTLLDNPETNSPLKALVSEDDIPFHERGHQLVEKFVKEVQQPPRELITHDYTQNQLDTLLRKKNVSIDAVATAEEITNNLLPIALGTQIDQDVQTHYTSMLAGILSADLPKSQILFTRILDLQNSLADWLLTLMNMSNNDPSIYGRAFLRLYSKQGIPEALQKFSPMNSPIIGNRETKNQTYRQQMSAGLVDYID
jgi:hypothetical protein